MPPTYFPLRWESTGDQWWYASLIDWAAANGHYDLVRELLRLDSNHLIKLSSLRRIRRLEVVWDDEEQFDDVAKNCSLVAQKLLHEGEYGVAERKNRTLIEAARTMLADSKLPTTFWAEAVSTACYVQNRVLIVKPHNKTPYELFRGFKPAIGFMKPFGCHVTILNTLDNFGKFDEKSDEGFC
ncbi:retrovirus-related pol polyprotein from transposon TNT 1-94, partial [Tanacetum coccineum]